MKNLNDQFSDEEKQQLNYLGSMMGRPNTAEEQEMEDILEAIEKGCKRTPEQDVANQDQAFRNEKSRITRGIARAWGQRLLRKTSFETGRLGSISTRTPTMCQGRIQAKPAM